MLANVVSAKWNALVEDQWCSYVFFLYRTFFTVIRVWYAGPAAYYATSLIRTVITLVAYSNQGARPHVGITDDTLAVALFAESTDGWKKKDNCKMFWQIEARLNLNSPTPGCLRQKIKSGWCLAMPAERRYSLLKRLKAQKVITSTYKRSASDSGFFPSFKHRHSACRHTAKPVR